MTTRLAAACLLGWAATTNYTNHAAVIPLLMAELGFGPVQAGLLSTAFFVTLAVACVPAGMLSDRFGPTGVGTAGLAAVFASNLALGYARDFPDLVLIKVVGGLGCGLAFIAGMRYAALVVPPARIHRALGLYGGFVQLGGGTSLYLIPLLASQLGWRRAFVVSSGLIALSMVAMARAGHPHPAVTHRRAAHGGGAQPEGVDAGARAHRHLRAGGAGRDLDHHLPGPRVRAVAGEGGRRGLGDPRARGALASTRGSCWSIGASWGRARS